MAITIKKDKGGANQEPLQQAYQKAPKTLPKTPPKNTARFENSNFKNKKGVKMKGEFRELVDQLIIKVRRALIKDYYDSIVPKEVDMLVQNFDYGHEILPEIWTDGNYVVYIPEEGDSKDICWEEIDLLSEEISRFILSYHSV